MTPSITMLGRLATVLSVISTVCAVPQTNPGPIDCKKFSSDPRFAPSLNCVQFAGYPKDVSGSKVNFYHYTEGFDRNKDTTAQAIRDIRSAIDTSFGVYSNFQALPDVVIILSPTLPQAGTSSSTEDGSKCFLRVAEDKNDADGLGYKRTLAHEFFHCVTRKGNPNYFRSLQNSWWIEGSAAFFENEFYPNANPNAPIERYRPRRTLWGQAFSVSADVTQEAYSAGLFFEFLRNNQNWAYARIYRFVLAQISTTTDTAMRASLAGQDDVTSNFPLFAQAYKDGQIQFSDLSVAANNGDKAYEVPSEPYTVNLGRDGQKKETPIEGDPFTIHGAEITLTSGKTYTIKLDKALSNHGKLFYRKGKGSGDWKKFSSPETIKAPCGKDSVYEFLFTSTTDKDQDAAELSVTRKSKQKCCKKNNKRQDGGGDDDDDGSCPIPEGDGKGFILYPLRNSQGSAYCPKGSHLSTLAAWCCPDGSNLDEAVADQVSLCCPGKTDCYDDIIPNNLKCADPSWVLWNKDNRQVGCCQKGFVPTTSRYCVKDASQLGPGFTMMSQAAAAPTAA